MLSDTEFFITQAFKTDVKDSFKKVKDDDIKKLGILVAKNRGEKQDVRLLKKEREEFDISKQLDQTRTDISKRLETLMDKKNQFEERQAILGKVVKENETLIRETDKKIELSKARALAEDVEIKQKSYQIRDLHNRLENLKIELEFRRKQTTRYEPYKRFVQEVADAAGEEFSHDAEAVVARMRRLQKGFHDITRYVIDTDQEIEDTRAQFNEFVNANQSKNMILSLQKTDLINELERVKALKQRLHQKLTDIITFEQTRASMFGKLVLAIEALKERAVKSYRRGTGVLTSQELKPTQGAASRAGRSKSRPGTTSAADPAGGSKPTSPAPKSPSTTALVNPATPSVSSLSSNDTSSSLSDSDYEEEDRTFLTGMSPSRPATTTNKHATGSPTTASPSNTALALLGSPTVKPLSNGMVPDQVDLKDKALLSTLSPKDLDAVSPLRSGPALTQALDKGSPLHIRPELSTRAPAVPQSRAGATDSRGGRRGRTANNNSGSANHGANSGGSTDTDNNNKTTSEAMQKVTDANEMAVLAKMRADKEEATVHLGMIKSRVSDLGELCGYLKLDQQLTELFSPHYPLVPLLFSEIAKCLASKIPVHDLKSEILRRGVVNQIVVEQKVGHPIFASGWTYSNHQQFEKALQAAKSAIALGNTTNAAAVAAAAAAANGTTSPLRSPGRGGAGGSPTSRHSPSPIRGKLHVTSDDLGGGLSESGLSTSSMSHLLANGGGGESWYGDGSSGPGGDVKIMTYTDMVAEMRRQNRRGGTAASSAGGSGLGGGLHSSTTHLAGGASMGLSGALGSQRDIHSVAGVGAGTSSVVNFGSNSTAGLLNAPSNGGGATFQVGAGSRGGASRGGSRVEQRSASAGARKQ